MSPVILRNGSLVGLWRVNGPNGDPLSASHAMWSIQLVTARNWKDPSTYVLEHTDLFPDVGVVEDPHVYLDEDGYFHALFHHETGCPAVSWGGGSNCGGHAFSADGRTWLYPWINGSAYPQNASLVDGSVAEFTARQRPHMVLGPDGVTPVAVTNGVGLLGAGGKGGDHMFTFLQPIRQ